MDKIENFKRINQPRIDRALAQIGHIRNSAKSMRLVVEGEALLTQISNVVPQDEPPHTGIEKRSIDEFIDGHAPDEEQQMQRAVDQSQPVAFDQRIEIRWAFDAIRRGHYDIAEDRIKRVLDAWEDE